MSTPRPAPVAAHRCECGETFGTTRELLAHAQDEHGFTPL